MGEHPIFLSTAPIQKKDRRRACAVIIISLLIFLVLAPFAQVPMPQVLAFVPMYETAIPFSDLVTAAILLIQFNSSRSRAILALACGYLFTALMAIPHALTFPGLFSLTGLLGAGTQTTAWLYVFWHGGFPLAVICYTLLKIRDSDARRPSRQSDISLLPLGLTAVIGAAIGLTLLTTVGKALLPDVLTGGHNGIGLVAAIVADLMLALVALLFLWRRPPHAVLDMWLMVVMCAWLFDIALSALLNHQRFDLGFYAGRAYGLMAATFVLMVLLLETGWLYARLAQLLEVEHKGRQREVEKRLHVEAALLEHEDRERVFGAAVQSSQDAIVTKTLDGTVTGWNPAAERLFGYAAEEIVGKSIDMIVPEERRTELHDILARIGRGYRIEHHETIRLAKGGKRIDVSLSISPIKSPSGEIVGACKIARDVTEKKRIERMKDEFIATVSHELRTPVTTIAGPLGLLVGGAVGEMPDKVKRLVTMAHGNCTRLTQLVSDMLDLDRIESGNMPFDLRFVRIKKVVEQAIELNLPLAEKFGVQVRLDANAVDAAVRTDRERLMQVLANLLSNAVKFSPRGSEAVVSIDLLDKDIRIAVRDRGPGIPKDFKTLIFNKFVQVDATDARQKGGTGLGLSIVEQTMARLGGKVDHVAAPSGGTIFYVDLPRSDAETTAEPAAAASRDVA